LGEAQKLLPFDGEIQKENRIVSDWLLFHPDRKKEHENKREEILQSLPPSFPKGIAASGSKLVSDPTGRRATKLAELEAATGKWIKLIEEVEQRLPRKMKIFLQIRRELRYEREPHGWTAALQHRYAEALAEQEGKDEEEVWIEDRTTFWRWWNKIIEYTARLAAKRGLL